MKNLNWEQQTALKTFKEDPRTMYQWIERCTKYSLQGPNKEDAAKRLQDVRELFTWDESFEVAVEFSVLQQFTMTEPCDSAEAALNFLEEGEVDEDELNFDSASFAGDVCNDAPQEDCRHIVVTVKNLRLKENVPSLEEVVGQQ